MEWNSRRSGRRRDVAAASTRRQHLSRRSKRERHVESGFDRLQPENFQRGFSTVNRLDDVSLCRPKPPLTHGGFDRLPKFARKRARRRKTDQARRHRLHPPGRIHHHVRGDHDARVRDAQRASRIDRHRQRRDWFGTRNVIALSPSAWLQDFETRSTFRRESRRLRVATGEQAGAQTDRREHGSKISKKDHLLGTRRFRNHTRIFLCASSAGGC